MMSSPNRTKPFTQNILSVFNGKNLLILFIGVGILLRLMYYLQNCSLWLDEAWVALQLSTQTFQQISTLVPFSGDLPTLPVGYLLLEKIFISVFGNNEYALRLFPLIAGILSIFLFLPLLKQYACPNAVPVSLALFAVCGPLVYYSVELKQYSSDVLIAILLLWYAHNFHGGTANRKKALLFGCIGAVAVWFSYTAVFVLAGVSVTLVVFSIIRKQFKRAKPVELCLLDLLEGGILWAASFCGLYLLSQGPQVEVMKTMWAHTFVPRPVISWESLLWLKKSFLSMFADTAGLSAGLPAACIFVIGGAVIFRRDKEKFFLLIAPMIFVLLAASVRGYPFYGRFLLFLIPAIIIFVSEGLCVLTFLRPRILSITPWIIGAVLLYAPLMTAGQYAFYPCQKEQMRQAMQHVKAHYRKGDAVFMNDSAQFGFGYYHGYYKFMDSIPNIGKIEGKFSKDPIQSAAILFLRVFYDPQGYLLGYQKEKVVPLDLSEGLGPFGNNERTWFIFSNANKQQKKWILEGLERNGRQIKAYQELKSSAYLYDLR